ncbi:MAG: helix-hairpin-helix domain-containing protein, partial [Crocinitomicaceae bacterium]|nr:helix-hairpin-helix domain-containing protein [Crocinitomicaceae bacterium]
YAAQIIKYRKELGGFYKKEQLMEVWKMREETYEVLVTELILDSSHIQKIHLNSISFEVLKNHPYVSYSLANSIVKMRNQLGSFDTISSIKKSKLIDNEVYQKIRPYLSLE